MEHKDLEDTLKELDCIQDKTFLWGKVGFGSFDDTGRFDAVRVWGKKKEK